MRPPEQRGGDRMSSEDDIIKALPKAVKIDPLFSAKQDCRRFGRFIQQGEVRRVNMILDALTEAHPPWEEGVNRRRWMNKAHQGAISQALEAVVAPYIEPGEPMYTLSPCMCRHWRLQHCRYVFRRLLQAADAGIYEEMSEEGRKLYENPAS